MKNIKKTSLPISEKLLLDDSKRSGKIRKIRHKIKEMLAELIK